MEIQHAPVKFGTLTLEQQRSLDITRSGGLFSEAEAILYKQLGADAYKKTNQEPPMAADDSTALAKAIQGVVRWGMMSKISDEAKTKFQERLDNIRDLLISAPFAATDEVVEALAAQYKKLW